MAKIDLSRRQFINVTAASAGLFGMSGLSNLVLGEGPQDTGLEKLLRVGEDGIPYIGITEDGPLYVNGSFDADYQQSNSRLTGFRFTSFLSCTPPAKR